MNSPGRTALDTLPSGPGIVVLPGVWWEFEKPLQSAMRLSARGVVRAMENINRWTGNTAPEVTNLVEHSLHVAELVARKGGSLAETRTAAAHDAHEIIVGDASRPLKIAMRGIAGGKSAYDLIEDRTKLAFAMRFGLIHPHPEIVEKADHAVLGFEARTHYGVNPAHWGLGDSAGAQDYRTLRGLVGPPARRPEEILTALLDVERWFTTS